MNACPSLLVVSKSEQCWLEWQLRLACCHLVGGGWKIDSEHVLVILRSKCNLVHGLQSTAIGKCSKYDDNINTATPEEPTSGGPTCTRPNTDNSNTIRAMTTTTNLSFLFLSLPSNVGVHPLSMTCNDPLWRLGVSFAHLLHHSHTTNQVCAPLSATLLVCHRRLL